MDRITPMRAPGDEQEARQARVLLGIMLVGLPTSLLVASTRYLEEGLSVSAIAGVVGAVAIAIAYLAWRQTRSQAAPAHLLLLVAVIGTGLSTHADGGIHSPAAYWYPLWPLLAAALGGQVSVLFATGLTVALIAGHHFGTPAAGSLARTVSLATATVFVAGATALMDDARRRALEERERLDSAKDRWVSVVSHELRTPLTAIMGSLGLVKARVAGELPERVSHFIDIAEENSVRLARLVNDVLDMERIAQGHMTLRTESVCIGSLAEKAVATYATLAQESGVALTFATHGTADARVQADPDRLMQVLSNLMTNAIDFSPRGGEVAIGVDSRAERVVVSVQDAGPGIPESFRAKVFEPFEQADGSTERKHGGTGLGLAISRAIVERHRGELDFESEVGAGARFWFSLPRDQQPLG